MYRRVSECVFATRTNCRGCPYSYMPDLFDGGCRLHYEKEAYQSVLGGLPIRKDPPTDKQCLTAAISQA